MNLGDDDVTYFSLPPNFQTDKNRAFGYAIDRQIKKLMLAAERVSVWGNLDDVPEKYYDYLAASIKAPYYVSGYDAQTKLQIIKSTFQIYMFAGTRKSIEELASKIFLSETIFVPWYEYEGQPFHFKIVVLGDPLKGASGRFTEILRRIKAKRSVIDAIEYIIKIFLSMIERFELVNVNFHMTAPFWGCHVFNDIWVFDGNILFDTKYRYNMQIMVSHVFLVYQNPKETFALAAWTNSLKIQIPIKLLTHIENHFNISFYGSHLFNGAYLFDGSTEFDVGICHKLALKINNKFRIREKETFDNISIETTTKGYCIFDGSVSFDGTRKFNSFHSKEDI